MHTETETPALKIIENLFVTEVPVKNKMVRIFTSNIDEEKLAAVITEIQETYASASEFNKNCYYAEVEGVIFANPKNISARQLKSIFNA